MEDDRIIDYFSLLKKQNIIGKSYLFIGDNFTQVIDVVKLINCRQDQEGFCNRCLDCRKIEEAAHPDLFIVTPKTLSITIEDIKESQQFLRLKSFCAKYKIVIIKNAEAIGEAAANAFLKTLEEPPKNSLIIICASKLDGLLPTIISRCRKIFLPYSEPLPARVPLNTVLEFLKGQKPEFKDRSAFKDFLWSLAAVLRDYLVLDFVPENNRLLKSNDCEIILRFLRDARHYKSIQACDILNDIFKVYAAHNTINENLALNLIRMKL